MNASSASLPRDSNEFLVAGLTPTASRLVKPPRVAESPVHLECLWIKTVPLPSNKPDEPNTVVFGQVIGIHISDAVIKDGMIDMTVLKPIARLGYLNYTVVDNVFSMNRPEV
jgi:flavin reductase (DIM6/NTAB) family NADH-FMN oxidoreductase RutF